MIQHECIQYPSGFKSYPQISQATAEQLNRQEVTAEWYMTVGIDYDMQLWAWVSDEAAEMGMEPWRMIDGPEDAPNARYFVQRNHLARAEK